MAGVAAGLSTPVAAPDRSLLTTALMTYTLQKFGRVAFFGEVVLMLGKALIALAAAASWALVPQAASAGYRCYGNSTVVGSPRCAGVGLGLQSPRWYYSNNYPYWIYYSERPYIAFRDVVGGCYLIRRPVMDARSGWVTRTVEVCE